MKYTYALYVAGVLLVLYLVYTVYSKYEKLVSQHQRLETNVRKVIDIINEMCSVETSQPLPQNEPTLTENSDEPILIQVGKNSHCQFVLEAGKRRGFLCDKKSPMRDGLCKNHSVRVNMDPAVDELVEV